MQIQASGKPVVSTGRCPPFDPAPWHDKEIVWLDKLFVMDHVHSILHVPIDLGKKVLHDLELIDAAGARAERPLMLSDEKSQWGADLFIDVTKPVPGAHMAHVSGTFLTRVYEGPFLNAGRWVADMKEYVEDKGRILEQIYLGYTTCLKCAKAYGKNYVIVFAKVMPEIEDEAAQYQ